MNQIKSWKKSTHNTEVAPLSFFFAVKLALILIINSKISPDQCHFCNLFISMTVYTKLTLRSITPCDSHGMSKCKHYQRDSSINIYASLIIIIITTINIVIKSCKTKKQKLTKNTVFRTLAFPILPQSAWTSDTFISIPRNSLPNNVTTVFSVWYDNKLV